MRTLMAFTLAAACVAPALSAAEGTDVSSEDILSRVTLGQSIYGPAMKVEDLKGRVVLIEFWGQH
jgi:hypothetical protein